MFFIIILKYITHILLLNLPVAGTVVLILSVLETFPTGKLSSALETADRLLDFPIALDISDMSEAI